MHNADLGKEVLRLVYDHRYDDVDGGRLVEIARHRIRERQRTIEKRQTCESWTAIRERIYDRDGGICQVCRRETSWEQYQCGHLVDRCAGGSDLDDNLVVMCAPCNRWKPVHETREQYDAWIARGYWLGACADGVREQSLKWT